MKKEITKIKMKGKKTATTKTDILHSNKNKLFENEYYRNLFYLFDIFP